MRYILSSLEMAELERQTIADHHLSRRLLMELSGRALAACVQRQMPPGSALVVACGPGNNGGDGLVAARALLAAGYPVQVFIFADRLRLPVDAAAAYAALDSVAPSCITHVADIRALVGFGQACAQAQGLVDALLGSGLQEDVRGLVGEAIGILNDARRPVFSCDLPSGVAADTGAIMGRAVAATHTVTFAYPKRGHYLQPGAEACGELTVADIGIPSLLAERLGIVGQIIFPSDGPTLLRRRSGNSHKGTYGHLVIFAGAPSMPGAALLALQGARRAGVGRLSWATQAATLAHAAALPPEVVLRLRGDGEDLSAWLRTALDGATAVMVGPGLTTDAGSAMLLEQLLEQCRVPLCLDAGALTLLAAAPALWQKLQVPAVLTPHPQEMARLLGLDVAVVQRDRFAAALQLAIGRRVTVVLKGAGTLVAEPDGCATVVAAGNPGLATGGTGDVLAGVIGALLAQRLEPALAAQVGALLHGAAGDLAASQQGQAGVCASDVAAALGPVLAQWQR